MTEPANPLNLLPCPFCGGAAVHYIDVHKIHVVFCEQCPSGTWFSGPTAEQAAFLWNRRAEPTEALTEARAAGFADAIAEIEVRAAAFEAEITAGTWGPNTWTQACELRTMASILRRKAQGGAS